MLEFKDVSFKYDIDDYYMLKNLSFHINKGEFVSIIGPSGSGKSTFINMLGLLDVPDSGNYFLDNVDTKNLSDNEMARLRNQKIGFVFQNFNLLGKLTAWENVQVPLMYQGKSMKDSKKIAYEYLEKVGLKGRENHLPKQLSGGQQQRVAIARALASEAPVLLADEPTGNLDEETARSIMEILKDCSHKMNKCVVIVTHSKELAKQTDVVLRLRRGELEMELNR